MRHSAQRTFIRGRHYMRLTPVTQSSSRKDVCVVAEGRQHTLLLLWHRRGTGVPVCATAVVAFAVAFARDQ
jgi:hypothetical protein